MTDNEPNRPADGWEEGRAPAPLPDPKADPRQDPVNAPVPSEGDYGSPDEPIPANDGDLDVGDPPTG